MGDSLFNAILEWMQNNRIRLASYDRIVSSVPGASTPNDVAAVVGNYPGVFRTATIKGGLPGLALVDGYKFPEVTPGPALNVNDLDVRVDIPTAFVGYAEPARLPVEDSAVVGYATPATYYGSPAPTSAPKTSLTPRESVVKLLNLAADSDVSGSAMNYANAAVAAATAWQLLNDSE